MQNNSGQTVTKLERNQCEYCPRRNHPWKEFNRHLSGNTPVKRLISMPPLKDFLPPPPGNSKSHEPKDRRVFMVSNATAKGSDVERCFPYPWMDQKILI